MKISRRQLSKTTVRLLKEQPKNRDKIIKSVAAYLIDQRRTGELHLLLNDIARELQVSENHVYASVGSAFALDGATKNSIRTYLQQQTGATSVELEERVEPELLAGMILQTADMQLDTSAASKLKRLASLNAKEL